MRRVAGDGQPVRRVAFGEGQRQRIGEDRTLDAERAEIVGEAPRQLAGERVPVQREDAARDVAPLGPHDGRPVARHRQDRERAGGQETLLGDAAMGAFVRDGADDAGLVVAPFHRTQPGGASQRRFAAVGRDQQAGGERPAVVEPHPGFDRAALVPPDRRTVDEGRAAQRLDPPEERLPDMAVLHDVSERVRLHLPAVVVEVQRRSAVGDANLADRLGVAGKRVPDAHRGEDGPGAVRDRRYAAVEGRFPHRRRGSPVDDRNRHPGAAERGRERQPDHAAAADDYLEVRHRTAATAPASGEIVSPGTIARHARPACLPRANPARAGPCQRIGSGRIAPIFWGSKRPQTPYTGVSRPKWRLCRNFACG